MRSSSGWIGVDLDGTLAHYTTGTFDAAVVGEPIPPMVARVRRWLADGLNVRILTARVGCDDPSDPQSAGVAREAIREWCVQHLGREIPIVCEKDYGMIELWDDRAVQVVHNGGVPVIGSVSRADDLNFATELLRLAQNDLRIAAGGETYSEFVSSAFEKLSKAMQLTGIVPVVSYDAE